MYDWTSKSGRCTPNPALEPHYRQATSAAAAFLEQVIAEGREEPMFSGGFVASPKNQTAADMAAVVDTAISGASSDFMPTGAVRNAIVTFAVRGAHVVRQNGFGEKGWGVFLSKLRIPAARGPLVPIPPAAKPEPVAPAPTPTPAVDADEPPHSPRPD